MWKESTFHFSYISLGSSLESSFLFVTICSRMESASSTRAFMFSWQFLVLKASVPASLSCLPFLTLHVAFSFFLFFCLSECLLTFSYSQIWWAAWRSSSKLAIADLDWCGKRGRASLYWDQMAGFAEPEPWTVDQIRSFSFSFGGTDWLRLAGIGIILL